MTMGVDKHLAHRSRKLRRVGAIMVHARAHGQPARPSRPSARLASPGRRRQWLKGYLVAFGGKPVNGSYLSGHLEAFTRRAYRLSPQTARWKRGIIPVA